MSASSVRVYIYHLTYFLQLPNNRISFNIPNVLMKRLRKFKNIAQIYIADK